MEHLSQSSVTRGLLLQGWVSSLGRALLGRGEPSRCYGRALHWALLQSTLGVGRRLRRLRHQLNL